METLIALEDSWLTLLLNHASARKTQHASTPARWTRFIQELMKRALLLRNNSTLTQTTAFAVGRACQFVRWELSMRKKICPKSGNTTSRSIVIGISGSEHL